MDCNEYGLARHLPSIDLQQASQFEQNLPNCDDMAEVSSHFVLQFSPQTQHIESQLVNCRNKSMYLQSSLHNCPKHLIGFVNQALELKQASDLITNTFLNSVPKELKPHVEGLLRLIILSHRGTIRAMSREMLKIVFESGAETIRKLRLLKQPSVAEVFARATPKQMFEAKALLRQQTIKVLTQKKRRVFQTSRIFNKAVNSRYLQLFIQQLRDGYVRQRITKLDKIQIIGLDIDDS